ncbi:C39 family peptidase [Streptococcus himalayensis]|uniref:Peptidase C39-like domain-containing protein n=1 Tax=Streptococcus himalayensis TaxID=1888195 RepID=A0A917A952_9STRE|nr:C39 family peptidase [Streptococcus himalayensis]GGE32410.1 hypothetical protein GCM10011510_12130 [Streptococcus himalayensis]
MKKSMYSIFPLLLCSILISGCGERSNSSVSQSAKQQASVSTVHVETEAKSSAKVQSTSSSSETSGVQDKARISNSDTIASSAKAPSLVDLRELADLKAGLEDPKVLAGLNAGVDLSTPTTSEASNPASGQKHVLTVKGQIQQVWNYCAPTTVSMMLASRGIEANQFQLAKEMGTYDPFGTHNKDAIRILNKYLFGYEYPSAQQPGYRLETVRNASSQSEDMKKFKQRLIQNIKDGYPMYYTFDVSKVNPGKSGEHNVIGIGYLETPDGKDIELLYYLDPSPIVQDPVYGGLKTITPEELLAAMLTCEEPNYAW